MEQWSELQRRLTVFDCTVYTFDVLLQQTGRTLHGPKSKAHSEQNTRSACDISTHTALKTKPASLQRQQEVSHNIKITVFWDRMLCCHWESQSPHCKSTMVVRNISNTKLHVQQHCSDNLPSPSYLHPCHI